MAVPSDGVTINYSWQLPAVGGDIGAWGGILNSVFGESVAGGTPVLGIDGVIKLLDDSVSGAGGALERITDLDASVLALESAATPAFYAKASLTFSKTVAHNAWSILAWGNLLFVEEPTPLSVYSGGSAFKAPAGSAGAWQIRTQITGPYWSIGGDGDNARQWELQIVQQGGVSPGTIAHAGIPYLNDGVDTDSGDVSVTCSALVEVTEADILAGINWLARVRQFAPDTNDAATIQNVDWESWMEVARVAPARVVAT